MFENTGLLLILVICLLAAIFFFAYLNSFKSKWQKERPMVDKAIQQFVENGGYSHIKYITVLIPCLNEYANLYDLLPRMPKSSCGHEIGIVVLDDGSTDDTIELTRQHNVGVVSTERQRGQGAAFRLGYALALAGGAQVVVTIDGDGQYRPEEMESVIKPVISDAYDFVIGSRILGGFERDDNFRILGVHVYGRLISLLLGVKITDSSSGYRAIRGNYLAKIVDRLMQDQYQTAEVLIELARAGARIGEAQIVMLKRKSGKSKKGNNIFFGFAYARTICFTLFKGNLKGETFDIPKPPKNATADKGGIISGAEEMPVQNGIE